MPLPSVPTPQPPRTTPVRPWVPLSDAEWEHVACYLAALDCGISFEAKRRGRPPENVRSRLDAIFRAVTLKHPGGGRAHWNQLPPEFGKADTVSKTYRRWQARGLWERLLSEVADATCPPILKDLSYYIVCAFRRGWKQVAVRTLLLVKRLGLYSALPGPGFCLPNLDASDAIVREAPGMLAEAQRRDDQAFWKRTITKLKILHKLAVGVRITRHLEPA